MSRYPEYPTRRKSEGGFFTFTFFYKAKKNEAVRKIVSQVLGIDVAQKELVVCLGRVYDVDWALELYAHHTFPNTKKGFAAMIAWVKKLTMENIPVRYVMEATGVYHEELAYFFRGQGTRCECGAAQQDQQLLPHLGCENHHRQDSLGSDNKIRPGKET